MIEASIAAARLHVNYPHGVYVRQVDSSRQTLQRGTSKVLSFGLSLYSPGSCEIVSKPQSSGVVPLMFTAVAIALILGAGWLANRTHAKDRLNVAILDDDEVRSAVLHARQDIKLVCFLLAGVIVMLGILADK